MENNRNLVLAFVISLLILVGFDYLYMKPKEAAQQAAQHAAQQLAAEKATNQQAAAGAATGPVGSIPTGGAQAQGVQSRDQIIAATPRVKINSPRLQGSIALNGGRIDDLILKDYHETTKANSPHVVLASPAGTEQAYYEESGWVPAPGSAVEVPTSKSLWTADGRELAPGKPLTLSFDNGQGIIFKRTYSLDDNYMFTISQSIENHTDKPVTLSPYSLIHKGFIAAGKAFFILHEGPIGVFGEKLVDEKYKDLEKDGVYTESATGGWVGVTDKYWMMALIPDQKASFQGRFTSLSGAATPRFQIDLLENALTVAPGAHGETTSHIFAGAKETVLLKQYEVGLGIPRFEDAIDWGWFVWITKPIFYTLHYFHALLGNFGLAIMLLTVLLKAAFFPLANKSYVAMSKMKKLQPKMALLKERYGDDKVKMQQAVMELYREEKVNPLAGCLPVVLQIPVFFALYKVIFVTIEMRHAPFYGWIHDLSAQDTLTPLNLFGLIPFDPPSFLMVGVWPILMGITMFFQQKLNPAPADPVQAKVMSFLPIMFTFMLASFPAGLVIYWTWNNLLSITQQWLIMKRMGVSVD
jgi:YidC/Oxa1 family membrane protein insertase